jgi:hypothetical protein
MKQAHRLGALAGALALMVAAAAVSADQAPAPARETAKALDIARLTTDGKLQKPSDLVNWVFLGTSLGMGYNPGSFNAARPGQFQVVLMEPNAFRHFVEHGSYAPGSMFVLAFYDADVQQRSINQNGFTQADLTNYEIHLLDPAKADAKDKGHAFYVFDAKDTKGSLVPPGNACVRCHVDHGAFDGTFAQFYPTLRPFVSKEALERAARDHNIR